MDDDLKTVWRDEIWQINQKIETFAKGKRKFVFSNETSVMSRISSQILESRCRLVVPRHVQTTKHPPTQTIKGASPNQARIRDFTSRIPISSQL